MSLFAIADTHLSLGTDKPMDIFQGWDNYVQRLEENWNKVVSDKDTVVIAGDISWAMRLENTKEDFEFLHNLPGKKLLLKGNHDYWWSTRRKMEQFVEQNKFDSIGFIHNSAEIVEDYAVCGTRGWMVDIDDSQDEKILEREVGRLEMSINLAEKTGKEPVVFLHYPPFSGNNTDNKIMQVLHDKNIKKCYYGHLHGRYIKHIEPRTIGNVTMTIVSCDALGFMPLLVR